MQPVDRPADIEARVLALPRLDRRRALAAGLGGLAWVVLGRRPTSAAQAYPAAPAQPGERSDPADPATAWLKRPGGRQEQDLVREAVGAAHGRVARLRELVDARPALAKCAWDWGFGDWETPIDAAAHTGQREIALYLLERGARSTLFSAAMLGQLGAVRAALEADPGAARVLGPHSLTLLHHARAGGDAARAVLEYLLARGDADLGPPREPLADADRRSLLGTYRLAGPESRPTEVAEVAEGMGGLTVKIGDGAPRGLLHRGGLEFQPAGAEAVRLRFPPAEAGRLLIVEDGATAKFLAP
jgi:hypothetical protein